MTTLHRVSLALYSISLTATFADSVPAQTSVERRIALNPGASIKGFVPAGSVRIIGWDRDSLVITGTVSSSDRFYFGGGRSGAKFGIEARSSGADSRPARLVVHLPRSSQLSMKGVSANIQAVDASGWFYTVGGNIDVAGRVGEVEAEAMDGNVSVSATARWVRARTASGTLRLTGAIEDAAASSITGPLFISSSGVVRGQFASVTGDIVFTAPLGERGIFSFDNHSGAVELRLAPSAAGTFSVTTISGVIENAVVAARPAGSQTGRGQTIAFRLGDGGSHVTIRTFKGTVRLVTLR
jgi:hypothetical protein